MNSQNPADKVGEGLLLRSEKKGVHQDLIMHSSGGKKLTRARLLMTIKLSQGGHENDESLSIFRGNGPEAGARESSR